MIKNGNNLTTYNCEKCGGPVEIYHPEKSHGFYCKHCKTYLFWNADKKDIYANIEREKNNHEKWMIKQKYKQEDKRAKYKIYEKKTELERDKSENCFTFGMVLLCFMGFIVLLFWLNYGNQISDKPKLKELESIEATLAVLIDKSDYDSAFIQLNKMEILQSLSSENREIWYEKQNNYASMISNKKRKDDLSNPDNIFAPLSYDKFTNKTAEESESIFINSGFINVNLIEIEGRSGLFKKKHTVDHIIFGNKTNFTTEDYINKNDPINIYYYSK